MRAARTCAKVRAATTEIIETKRSPTEHAKRRRAEAASPFERLEKPAPTHTKNAPASTMPHAIIHGADTAARDPAKMVLRPNVRTAIRVITNEQTKALSPMIAFPISFSVSFIVIKGLSSCSVGAVGCLEETQREARCVACPLPCVVFKTSYIPTATTLQTCKSNCPSAARHAICLHQWIAHIIPKCVFFIQTQNPKITPAKESFPGV